MRKFLASMAIAATSLLVMPFTFASQAYCDDASIEFATVTDSSANRTAAKLAKTSFCRTLAVAQANRG